MTLPLVSCLMVTRDRRWLARRAVECFSEQTWENRELVIIDDGTEDYEPILEAYRAKHVIHYHRVPSDPELRLGGLRNLSLEQANGELLVQWDDDEWYHPERIEQQARVLLAGCTVTYLEDMLVHIDLPRLVDRLYHTRSASGTVAGTVMHKRTDVRYPNLAKAEDSLYLRQLRGVGHARPTPVPHTHLMIRCYHGNNTWALEHFVDALSSTWPWRLCYLWAKYVARDIRRHPAFRLTAREQETARQFLAASRRLGLVCG